MIVGIVGSRHWEDYPAFLYLLPNVPMHHIVSGGARGVDWLAERLARGLSLRLTVYRPDDGPGTFTQRCRARNQRIVDAVEMLVAFPGPRSRGTWDTIRRAREKGIPVTIINAPV